jgi:predicted PurR-regulated permease PerM
MDPRTGTVSESVQRSPFAVKVIAVIALLFLLKATAVVLLPVLIAIILTFLLAPLVRALRQQGVDDALGAAAVVFGLLLALGVLASRLAGPATEWMQRAPSTLQQLSDAVDRVRESLPFLAPPPPPPEPVPPPRPAARGEPPPEPAPPPDPVKDKIATESVTITGNLLLRAGMATVSAVATVILLFFLLASERWLMARTIEAIPKRRTRVAVLGGVRAAQRDIARFLGAQAIINVGVGLATGIAVGLLGLPNPTLWGTIAGLLGFIPYLGPLATIVLLTIAGSLTFDNFGAMVAPAVAFGVINLIESNFVSPWFVGKRLEMSPLFVFMSVMACGWIWGLAGAFIAVPLLVAIRAAARRSKSMRLWCVYLDRGREPPTVRSMLGLRRFRRRASVVAVENTAGNAVPSPVVRETPRL